PRAACAAAPERRRITRSMEGDRTGRSRQKRQEAPPPVLPPRPLSGGRGFPLSSALGPISPSTSSRRHLRESPAAAAEGGALARWTISAPQVHVSQMQPPSL